MSETAAGAYAQAYPAAPRRFNVFISAGAEPVSQAILDRIRASVEASAGDRLRFTVFTAGEVVRAQLAAFAATFPAAELVWPVRVAAPVYTVLTDVVGPPVAAVTRWLDSRPDRYVSARSRIPPARLPAGTVVVRFASGLGRSTAAPAQGEPTPDRCGADVWNECGSFPYREWSAARMGPCGIRGRRGECLA